MSGPSHDLPNYLRLMLPVLRAMEALGGSASRREVNDKVIEIEGFSDEQIAITYPGRVESVLIDRMDWARSYCKLAGVLDRPSRNLYLISQLGHEILAMDEDAARARLLELDRAVRAARTRKPRHEIVSAPTEIPPSAVTDEPLGLDAEDDTSWTKTLLVRLHQLSPKGFEEFSLYLLREFGMELDHRGGPGDEGIDGIGTAPLSEVLSATVAVQVKRYDPTSERAPIGRDTVALFQRDAMAAGAERAVLVTLGRFSPAARKAATSFTPKVDLIDGERLCELALAKRIGVTQRPVVDVSWFDRFD